MFSGIYCGLSGMKAYSEGLDTISNNVANLNTPGYKRNELLFRDAYYTQSSLGDNGPAQMGEGVRTDKTTISFVEGDLRESGNSTDVAIDGNGFFVLQDEDNNTVLTRAGEFDIGEDGYLVDKNSGRRLAGLSGNTLEPISLAGYRSDQPTPTDRVTFSGNLSTGSAKHVIDNLEIIDSTGEKKTLKVVFVSNSTQTNGSWLVEVQDDAGNVISAGNEIRFNVNGSPMDGWNQFTFTYDAAAQQDITLFLGEPGSFSGGTSFAGGTTSSLETESVNGNTIGSLTEIAFSSDGKVIRKYSNGQEYKGQSVAIGWVNDPQALIQDGRGVFRLGPEQQLNLSNAGLNGVGRLVGGSVELSNVDLTSEFTNMIIIQRGYQASSQVLTTANEMMQQLLDTAKGR
jgi:flagellar hook protein FlgE